MYGVIMKQGESIAAICITISPIRKAISITRLPGGRCISPCWIPAKIRPMIPRYMPGIVDFDAYRKEQQVWLEEVMQSRAYKKAKFKVVLMHIPPFYSGDWHGTMHCRELFNPVFNKYRVDMVISGHTHKHGVHPPVKEQHRYPIIIGGGPKEGQRTLIKLQADA